jgi:pimeloyl-ACP methyl ester carboxylesterase
LVARVAVLRQSVWYKAKLMAFSGGMRWVVAWAVVAVACGDDGGPAGSGTDGSTTADTSGTTMLPTTNDESSSSGPAPSGFCEGATQLLYDPATGRIDAFPDDVFTVDDDGPTGVRVDMRPGENVLLEGIATRFQTVVEQASTLDGFGTTSAFMFQVTAALDPASLPESGTAAVEAMVLVDLDADPPAFVPFEWSLVAEDPGQARTTVVVTPMVPLDAATRYGVAMTTAVTDTAGACVSPSPAMLSLLQGDAAAPVDRLQGRIDDLVGVLVDAGTIAGVEDLSAAFVYTTQTTVDEAAAIAQEIRAADAPTYTPDAMACEGEPTDPFITCTGTFDALDYTGVDEAITPDLQAGGSYAIPVVAYIPNGGTPPYEVIVYGHGLAGDRTQGAELAELSIPSGIAVIAIDAPKHGDHPDGGGIDVLEFFGLSLDLNDPLDALKLRDNFRQGGFDRLQLVQLLLAGVDLDGDEEVDLDPDRIHYLGVSLGGIMGAQLVAFAPELRTATFIVPGARVSGIVKDGDAFAQVVDIFASSATDGEFERFFPLLQSIIDRGDAGIYARHVLPGTRLAGFDEAAPQVLMQMVIDDDTVPNSANSFFARALGAPHVGEERLPIGVIEHVPGLPVSGNVDAMHTAGMFQFDMTGDGEVATHSNVARSPAGQAQTLRFLESEIADGVSEIIDPY